MNDFPARSLENIATHLDQTLGVGTVGARDIRRAIKAHAELSERHVMEIAELRGLIGQIRAERSKERRHLRGVEHVLAVQLPDDPEPVV